ncbi:2-phospho-L-lactate guanylyltransferase [Kineococcus rhizosphaerae]|uniref:Phosphoenolpyruvate guanylyltransferase n=1 Tax=Kineococcus rhizosphaerae TaxID=559628 RepID=A0A2T0R0S3_9ACTN|nr:2-phospho-L-lactate guanylyltransferase [Kineococcus rhizosphaerae]PRY12896.1 2-phospho-L-lactate guanylyltransferase [Kineococcus rhizosphaerae]
MTHVSGWRIVVPVKGGDEAKTRLALPPGPRRALALAMALDCLEACLATPGVGLVVCVSDDRDVLAAARAVGAVTVSPGRPGLAQALDAGLASLERGPTAVLLGDVPALRPADLAAALDEALSAPGPALVTDAEGTGSVLLADVAGDVPHRFGPGSARRHLDAGAHALSADLPSLRRDVDTLTDLAGALSLGVGPRTRDALPHGLLAECAGRPC